MSQKTHVSTLAGPSTVEHDPMSSITCFPCPKGPPRCTEGRRASQAVRLVLAVRYRHWLPGFTQGLFLTPPVACGQFRERWGGEGVFLDTWPYCSLCIQTLSCLFWPRILRVNPGSVLWSLGPLLPLFLFHLSLGLGAPPCCIICQSWWVWPLLLPLLCSPPLALMKISLSINRCLPSGRVRGWEAWCLKGWEGVWN